MYSAKDPEKRRGKEGSYFGFTPCKGSTPVSFVSHRADSRKSLQCLRSVDLAGIAERTQDCSVLGFLGSRLDLAFP